MPPVECPKEFHSLYRLLDEYELHQTVDLLELPEEVELELVGKLYAIWAADLVEPIRQSRLRKFAIHVDRPLSDLVVKHGSSYSDFAFYVTQAVTSLDVSMDERGREEQARDLIVDPSEWIELRAHRLPRSLVESLQKVRPAVLDGTAMLVPTWLDGSRIAGVRASFAWPVVRDRTTVDINLTRFKEIDPWLYAGGRPVGCINLRVPALAGVSFDTLMKIRRDEEEAFSRFTGRFFRMVKDYEEDLESERAVVEAMEEVNDAVRQLEERYARIRRSWLRSAGEVALTATTTCLCLMVPEPFVQSLAALFGGRAGSKALQAFGEYREDVESFRQEDFYVPWLIARESGA